MFHCTPARLYHLVAYLNGVFANTKGVPQLDGLVPGARHNLAVISRESHAQNILSVANKVASGGATGTKCR